MKINDLGKLDRVDEAIPGWDRLKQAALEPKGVLGSAGNYLARKGLSSNAFGMRAQQSYERSAAMKAHKQQFLSALKDAWDQSVNSGMVDLDASNAPSGGTVSKDNETDKTGQGAPSAPTSNPATQADQLGQGEPSAPSAPTSKKTSRTNQAGQKAFGNMAQGLSNMAQNQLTPQELAAQKRQQKLAAATAAINPPGQPSGQFSRLPDKQTQAGEKAFGSMAQGLDQMAQKSPVTTMPPGSRQLGPKGRETLARLGKQKQARSSGNQGVLDLTEALNDYSMFNNLIESVLLEQGGISPSGWLLNYIENQTTSSGIQIEKFRPALAKIAQNFEQEVRQTKGAFPDAKTPTSVVNRIYDFYASAAASSPKTDKYGASLGGRGDQSNNTNLQQKSENIDQLKDQLTTNVRSVVNTPKLSNIKAAMSDLAQLLMIVDKQRFDQLFKTGNFYKEMTNNQQPAANPQSQQGQNPAQ